MVLVDVGDRSERVDTLLDLLGVRAVRLELEVGLVGADGRLVVLSGLGGVRVLEEEQRVVVDELVSSVKTPIWARERLCTSAFAALARSCARALSEAVRGLAVSS